MNAEHCKAYTLLQEQQIDDIHAHGYLLRHNKSGARVLLLETEDDNKVFNIAFRTPPADSTGVAHILEHSVLCGSREFPLKDPFVELVKGSLNTFLNAMTYPDKTMYPVASTNDADFQNLMRHRTALTSMTVGMFIMPLSALCMASGNMLNPESTILTMHPVAFMMVVGIVFQGLAETFISPRFLEYFSLQAPKGEEGLYLGFSHLHSFLSSILGFGLSGYLLSKYCPDESLFATRSEWLAASSNAHYIWYYFAVIALASAIALIIYGQVVKRLDQAKA